MPEFKLNGQVHNDVQILKLKKGQEEAAKKAAAASNNGTDDVFFKVGEDTFVASGRDLLKHKGLYFFNQVDDRGVTVEYDGQKREITNLQNQANTPKEGMLWGLQIPGMMAALPLLPAARALLGRQWTTALKFGAPAAAALGALAAGGWLYGKHRKVGFGDLNKSGEVVQKATFNPGGIKEFFKGLFK